MMAIPISARKWGIRLLKTVWYLLISLAIARTLGPTATYLDHDVASAICDFIYGDVNAETMYETYINIDILIVLSLTTVIYLLTMKLFNKIRKK